MSNTNKPGFTTQIVHADQHFGVEHGGIHKPIHTSVQYGYDRVDGLVDTAVLHAKVLVGMDDLCGESGLG